MDRYLIKSPSWKTVDCSFSRSFAGKSFTDKKSTPKKATASTSSRRLSIRDETLKKIFSSQPDQPLNDENANPALFRTNSIPAKLTPGDGAAPLNWDGDLFGNIGSSCHIVREETSQNNSSGRMSVTPTTSKTAASSAEGIFAKDNPMYLRLQRDLNSPSANARLRAVKALRNPTACAYTHFDVPHQEQDIITEEERRRPKNIQEVMKDVVIYVEVRTGEDNRSAGVKKVISQLGARVNDKLLRDTTHVVFKDGLHSTYNKAKKWNIPIVSILWIEACKKHMILMSPKLYPISNVERYENPELFTKMKRQKSMQPNAEENVRRNKVKLAVNKETETNKTATISSAIRIPRKPKDKLNQIFSEFQERLLNTPEDSDIMNLDSKLLQRIRNSPFTPPVKNTPKQTFDSLQKLAVLDSNIDENSDDDFEKSKITTPSLNAKKILNFGNLSSAKKSARRATIVPKSTPRRRSSLMVATSQMDLSPTDKTETEPQSMRTRRRSLMSNYSPFTKTTNKTFAIDIPIIKETVILEETCDIDEIRESNDETGPVAGIKRRATTFTGSQLDITKDSTGNIAAPSMNQHRRRTLYTPQAMEQTNNELDKSLSGVRRTICFTDTVTKEISPPRKANNVNEPIIVTDNCPPSLRKSYRRKTIFNTSCAAEESNDSHRGKQAFNNTTASFQPVDLPNNSETAKTPVTKIATILDDFNSSLAFNSTKTPTSTRRRTMFDISMDIIDQRVQNINKSTKQTRENTSDLNLTAITKMDSPTKAETVANSTHCRDKAVEKTQPSINSFYKSLLNQDNSKQSTHIDKISTTVPKKRKLFDPTELLFSPFEKEKKRSREDDDLKKPVIPKKSKTDTKVIKTISRIAPVAGKTLVKKRRSTLDFEQVRNLKIDKTVPRPKPETAKINCLVYTNMHTEQINFIKEAVKTLGGFKIEDTVSDNTTHIVSLEPRRTFNLLRGIIRGLWILDYNWILESVRNGKWIFEEPYEMNNFSRAIEICRSERQAFGTKYKIDLFVDMQPIYVSPSSNIPAKSLEELILLCSGQIVKNKNSARYILGESSKQNPLKICLQPIWILDSIADNQIKKVNKYFITD